MLGAIYTALSGLNAHSKGLQQVGNNVTNMNTLGYKGTTITFLDQVSGGSTGLGNVGSGQSQSGVSVGPETIDFRQGDMRQTGNPLDLAIQGNGFLVLQSGERIFYGRTGEFKIDDKDGFLVDQITGDRLMMLDSSNELVPINIGSKRTDPPAATTSVHFSGHLSSTLSAPTVLTAPVFDSSGARHLWSIKFTPPQDATTGEWAVEVTDELGAILATSTLKFTQFGNVDPSTSRIEVTASPTGAAPLIVELDFSSGVDDFSFGTSSTLQISSSDGNAAGSLTSVTIDADGKVKLSYSNGKDNVLGAVAIASFDDPEKLQRADNGLFVAVDTQSRHLASSGAPGVGNLLSGQVESSNVNLADQFGELILIQRGFQASSQVISIANDMIQQLFAMKGQ